MAESLLAIRAHLSSIRSISKITKAMKLVAASKYKRAKENYLTGQTYAAAMADSMALCLSALAQVEDINPAWPVHKPGNRNLYVLVTSNLGLCGTYNYDLYRALDRHLQPTDDIVFIGDSGYRHYKDRRLHNYVDFISANEPPLFASANHLRHYLNGLYRDHDYQTVYLVSTHFKNSLSFKAQVEQIIPPLPVEPKPTLVNEQLPQFDFDPATMVETVGLHHLDALIYARLTESYLCEQASRRNSMEAATDSAEKLMDELKLTYNKVRQQRITQEISEVINGAGN